MGSDSGNSDVAFAIDKAPILVIIVAIRQLLGIDVHWMLTLHHEAVPCFQLSTVIGSCQLRSHDETPLRQNLHQRTIHLT